VSQRKKRGGSRNGIPRKKKKKTVSWLYQGKGGGKLEISLTKEREKEMVRTWWGGRKGSSQLNLIPGQRRRRIFTDCDFGKEKEERSVECLT